MAKIDAQSFEHLACVLGTHVAGEVLLLAVARTCGGNASLWDKARSAGIPWQRKNWTALSKLQQQYNGAAQILPPLLESKETVLGADRAEESESLVGGDGAGLVARTLRDNGPYAPRLGLGSAAAPARRRADKKERDDALSGSSKKLADAPLARALRVLRWALVVQ